MTNILFNKKHLKEYAVFGSIAGACHGMTVWHFLYKADYHTAPVLFTGSIFFMFVIMIYTFKLVKRRPDDESVWLMLISGVLAVSVGVFVSATASIILCSIYIPGFTTVTSTDYFLQNVPRNSDTNFTGTLELIFTTATFENFGAGTFISAMIAYAIKPDQTKDRTPLIFKGPVDPGTL